MTVQTDYDNWNGGAYLYMLYLQLPLTLYTQIEKEKKEVEENILTKINSVTLSEDSYFRTVSITLKLLNDTTWREKANAWLSVKQGGKSGVSCQSY